MGCCGGHGSHGAGHGGHSSVDPHETEKKSSLWIWITLILIALLVFGYIM